jgi:glycosyltransferase involved in cell wall biosynthesis
MTRMNSERWPHVSVVLPVRDGVATIGRALASVRVQTFQQWELLVVDDGSRDASAQLVRGVARVDPRVRLLERPRDGIVAALNAGLDAARGEFIARMDADDEAHPERLAEQVAFLRERGDCGLVSCLVEFGGDRERSAGYALHVDWINSLVTPEQIALRRFVESPVAHPSVLFRRELVERGGDYREGDFPEDYELWLRWLDAGVRFGKVPRVLLRWHDAAGRASRTDRRYDPEAFFRVKAAWLARELPRRAASRPIWIWGAGRPTRKRAGWLANAGVRISGYIDVDVKKQSPALGGRGVPVIGPEALGTAGPAGAERFVLVYVSARGARELIAADLEGRGFQEGRDFLLCA